MSMMERIRHLRKNKLAWMVLALALLTILLGVFRKGRPHAEPAQEKAVPVTVMTAELRRAAPRLMLTGRIEGMSELDLATEKAGRVVKLGADKGDRVKAGDVLLRLDDRVWKAALERARLALKEAERDLARWEELSRSGAVSASDYESMKTRRDQARTARDEAEALVSQCVVRTPVDGVVDERLLDEGEYANEGMLAFRVVAMDEVKLLVDVPEREIAAVHAGEPMEFTVDALGGAAFTGTVSFVSVAASRENNAFRSESIVSNPDHRLKPGMMARVRLERQGREETIVLPLNAIVPKKGEYFVFIADNGQAVRRRVNLDAVLGEEAIVSKGLKGGESVILEGNRTLSDGMPVVIRTSAETEAGQP